MNVAKYLRKMRIKKGLTQAQVGKTLHYSSPQFISNLERGKCPLPIPLARELTKIYDIPPEGLIKILVSDYKKKLQCSLKD